MATDWNGEATKVAKFLRSQMHHAHRGAFAWHNQIVIAFGNRGATEVPFVRDLVSRVFEPATIVLGLGVNSAEASSWAMILRTGTDHDARTLAAALDVAVWRAAFGCSDKWSEPMLEQFNVLRDVAERAIQSLDVPELD